MSETTFKITFSGKTADGLSVDSVKAKLCEILPLSSEQVNKLFRGKETVVKTGLSRERALKIQMAFRRAGAICSLLASEDESADDNHPSEEPELDSQENRELTVKELFAEAIRAKVDGNQEQALETFSHIIETNPESQEAELAQSLRLEMISSAASTKRYESSDDILDGRGTEKPKANGTESSSMGGLEPFGNLLASLSTGSISYATAKAVLRIELSLTWLIFWGGLFVAVLVFAAAWNATRGSVGIAFIAAISIAVSIVVFTLINITVHIIAAAIIDTAETNQKIVELLENKLS